jgi:hypothetical protein
MKTTELRKNLTEAEFERHVRPYLPFKVSGRRDKVALWIIYNYIVKVLRTGMQWSELQDCIQKDEYGIAEIHYTTVFRRYNQWSRFRVFDYSFQSILAEAAQQEALDLSLLNGDGTNTVAKKGGAIVATPGINISKEVSVLSLPTN